MAARIPTGAISLSSAAACDHADAHDQPDRPRKIVHANLNMRDHDASLAFFTKTLGFRVVDENAPLTFLHCANADHCSIVLAKTDLPTLNHIAFDVPDLDSVMRGMGRMKDNGYPIEWGPGRHGPGNNVFAYFCGPDEVPLEYAAEVQQIDDSYQPRRLGLLEIQARPLRAMGPHRAALDALLPGAAAVRIYGRWGAGELTQITRASCASAACRSATPRSCAADSRRRPS